MNKNTLFFGHFLTRFLQNPLKKFAEIKKFSKNFFFFYSAVLQYITRVIFRKI